MTVTPCRQLQNRIHDSGCWKNVLFRRRTESAESAGEHVELSCDAGGVDSSPLKIEVTTPNAQNFEVKFDLENLR